ncbi:MAG: DNA polymerase III subunit epsilon [Alphaproteobacteria bacterium HGW-Alphaproteobacteria-2]|nr:MAG: DNA polymerase III subunit epsilon [Alphaproteobacteria bacterium HGW-Alphaproteobacteria-2]
MREIVLDTETTGLDPAEGHRIVEIGAVELVNHIATGRQFHAYFNPDRPMPPEAFAIHGLGDDFLAAQPHFAERVAELLDFLGDARLVIHNAAFDMRFLNAEFAARGLALLPEARAIDTLEIARRRFPGAGNSLDALCRRFGIDNSGRSLHGALLDAQLLAEVYLELRGGRQPGLGLAGPVPGAATAQVSPRGPGSEESAWRPGPRPNPLAPRLTPAERAAHEAFAARLGPGLLWPAGEEA